MLKNVINSLLIFKEWYYIQIRVMIIIHRPTCKTNI